jgi:hypothetical protein
MAVTTTRITVETETVTIVHQAKVTRGWCSGCQGDVDLVITDGTAGVHGASAEQIRHWISESRLHAWQTADSQFQFCVRSLLQCLSMGTNQ